MTILRPAHLIAAALLASGLSACTSRIPFLVDTAPTTSGELASVEEVREPSAPATPTEVRRPDPVTTPSGYSVVGAVNGDVTISPLEEPVPVADAVETVRQSPPTSSSPRQVSAWRDVPPKAVR